MTATPNSVAASAALVLVLVVTAAAVTTYDDFVTHDIIFGSGNTNRGFTITTEGNIEYVFGFVLFLFFCYSTGRDFGFFFNYRPLFIVFSIHTAPFPSGQGRPAREEALPFAQRYPC